MRGVKLLRMRVPRDFANNKEVLAHELRNLALKVNDALKALDAGKQIDDHLITNSGQITRHIARHNYMLDLLPLLEEDESRMSQVMPATPGPIKK
jgi:hypothetical protein